MSVRFRIVGAWEPSTRLPEGGSVFGPEHDDTVELGDAIGPWEIEPTAITAGLVSFADPIGDYDAASSPTTAEPPRWRMDVDGPASEASASLNVCIHQLALQEVASTAALRDWPTRLERELDSPEEREADASTTPSSETTSQESVSRSQLRLAQQQVDTVSRTTGDADERYELKNLATRIESILRRLTRLVLNHAWVETWVDGRLQARTVMGLAGDTKAIVASNIAPETLALHTRQVTLAVRTRDLWTRILITVVRLIARLSATGLTPVALVAALPAVFQMLCQLLRDLSNMLSLQKF